jgi:hypothetical protein
MASVSIVKLKVRRGSDEDRKKITLDIGEIGYVSDIASRRIFVGDGSTKGGNPAGIKLYSGDFNSNPGTFATAQVGDIVFNTSDTRLYTLTGYDEYNFPNYSQPSAYAFIGTRPDNKSLEYSPTNGTLQIKVSGVNTTNIDNSIFSPAQGLKRDNNGPLGVNVDNTTIKINSENKLFVDASVLSIDQFNSLGVQVNLSNYKINNWLNFDPAPFTGPGQAYGQLWVDANGFMRVSISAPPPGL